MSNTDRARDLDAGLRQLAAERAPIPAEALSEYTRLAGELQALYASVEAPTPRPLAARVRLTLRAPKRR